MTEEVDTCRVTDWVVRRVADEGIGHIFLLPGGGAMHLNDAITLEPRVRGVVCQHEQACGIAAECTSSVISRQMCRLAESQFRR